MEYYAKKRYGEKGWKRAVKDENSAEMMKVRDSVSKGVNAFKNAKISISEVKGKTGSGWKVTVSPSYEDLAKSADDQARAVIDAKYFSGKIEAGVSESSDSIGDADPQISFYSTAVTKHFTPLERKVVLFVMGEVKGISDFHKAKLKL